MFFSALSKKWINERKIKIYEDDTYKQHLLCRFYYTSLNLQIYTLQT